MNTEKRSSSMSRHQLIHAFLPTIPQLPLTNKLFGGNSVTPPLSMIALNRMAFGPSPEAIDEFNALGANDDARLLAYIEQQLNPFSSVNNSEYSARLAEANFLTINKTRQQLWQQHYRHDGEYSYKTLALREVERLLFIRAVYNKRQLIEVLADFWHNHFNVYAWSMSQIAALFMQYDRDVIRGHMLGNFREMLTAVAQSTEMLYYLDNQTSSAAGPNENWARELFELHTLGAENYLGVMRQNDVPLDNENRPIGYVDDDVYEATRCFTGWTVANKDTGPGGDTGLFLYRADWHDRFQKTILGNFISADQPAMKDGHDVLDFVAYHPGTARHIARKLCRRLVSDYPPQSLVDSTAAVFIAQQNAPDQLKRVVRHILQSNEFKTTWGEKVKRPFEAIVSAMRATNADFTIKYDDSDSNSFMWRYDQMGQAPFAWHAPDGYPDTKEHWQNSSSLVMRWRMVNWLVDKKDEQDQYRLNILGQTPGNLNTATGLVDYWIDRILGYSMSADDRQLIIDFMAQESGPLEALDMSNKKVQDRLRSMVGLILNSPQFQLR
ncbi:MAG: DUF1800 domain-containing protein [Chloroflexota bacterium]